MCVNAPEYLEAFFAAQKLGCCSGQRELPLRRRRARVPARQLRRRRARVPRRVRGDGRRGARDAAGRSATTRAAPGRARRRRALLDGARDYEDAIAGAPTVLRPTREPSGDDLIFLYTGGTTGCPKGVMWRNDDLYVVALADGAAGTEPPDVATVDRAPASARRPCCPRARSCTAPACSSRSRRSPAAARSCCSTRRASTPTRSGTRSNASTSQVLTIVGDVFARPLLAALDAAPDRWDLSSSAGDHVVGCHVEPREKRGLLAHLPGVHAHRLARRVRRAS